ncbi:MAG: hypothetical protein MUC96_12915 [Myxococcaceae bacterium]|nr:hypothetical protein [Myxococcaceae bacterium]
MPSTSTIVRRTQRAASLGHARGQVAHPARLKASAFRGAARATGVLQHVVVKLGTNATGKCHRPHFEELGAKRPTTAASNDTGEGRERNRRVDFVVVDEGAATP